MLPLILQFVIAMIASAINERMRRKLDYAGSDSACRLAFGITT